MLLLRCVPDASCEFFSWRVQFDRQADTTMVRTITKKAKTILMVATIITSTTR